jgi:hypothetical protein
MLGTGHEWKRSSQALASPLHAYARGFSQAFLFWPERRPVRIPRLTTPRDDREAIAGDWRVVGQEVSRAARKARQG